MEYYRTKGGHYYQYNPKTNKRSRISKEKYLKGKFGQKKLSEKFIEKRSRPRSSSTKRKRSRRTSRQSPTERRCRSRLNKKVEQLLKEFEMGKFQSRSQALAVAYSMTARKHPECQTYFQP